MVSAASSVQWNTLSVCACLSVYCSVSDLLSFSLYIPFSLLLPVLLRFMQSLPWDRGHDRTSQATKDREQETLYHPAPAYTLKPLHLILGTDCRRERKKTVRVKGTRIQLWDWLSQKKYLHTHTKPHQHRCLSRNWTVVTALTWQTC